MGERGKTAAAQHAAMSVLLNGQEYTAAAEAAGVSVRTIVRWMKPGHPFRAEFDELELRRFKQRISQMAAAGSTAIRTLEKKCRSRDEQVAVRAATELAKLNMKAIERADRLARSTDSGAGDLDRFLEQLGV